MNAGKPQKQSLAIAYAMKRRAKKAMGGEVCAEHGQSGCEMCKMAEGGMVHEEKESGYEAMPEDGEKENEAAEMEDDDMIGRIMKMRMMSKGGMVANDTPIVAGFEPNDFDDLALRDDLESRYTGANSGDEIGNERMDEDDHDIVARVMRSRAKKDRMPRPA